MLFFPLKKTELELEVSREEFYRRIYAKTEKNIPLLPILRIYPGPDIQEYAREIDELGIKVWNIQNVQLSRRSFIFVVTNANIIEEDEKNILRYYVRLNVWSYMLLGLTIYLEFYLLKMLWVDPKGSIWTTLIPITFYIYILFSFKIKAKADHAFMKSLVTKES